MNDDATELAKKALMWIEKHEALCQLKWARQEETNKNLLEALEKNTNAISNLSKNIFYGSGAIKAFIFLSAAIALLETVLFLGK